MVPPRPRRRAAGALALAVSLSALAACSGDDGGSGGGGSDDPDGFTYEAARLCSDVINDIDHDVAERGEQASLDLVLATAEDAEPDAATAERWVTEIRARHDQLVAVRDRLGELEPDSSDEHAWGVVVAGGDEKIDLLARRADLLEAGDWVATRGGIELGGGGSDSETFDDALVTLALVGRDCEVVFDHRGNPEEYAAFLDAASSTCTTIASRRHASGFTTDLSLSALAATLDDQDVEITPELTAEVDAAVEEWTRTIEDLNGVPAGSAPDAGEWDATRAAAPERLDLYERRAAALETGAQAAVNEAFARSSLGYTHPGFGDFQALGLDRRDCRSVSA